MWALAFRRYNLRTKQVRKQIEVSSQNRLTNLANGGAFALTMPTDTLDGKPIRVRFHWLKTDTASPRWEQAMSVDGGETWETNWTMDFHRR